MSLNVLFKAELPGTRSTRPAELSFGGSRIPRETFRALSLADDVLREAETAATQLRHQTAAAFELAKQQGHVHGFSAGKTEATVAVLGTLEFERQLRDLLSHRLADIVERCVRDILGDLGELGLMRQRVLHLLCTAGAAPTNTSEVPSTSSGGSQAQRTQSSATLHVCPEQLALARDIVAKLDASYKGNVAGLVVVADDRRAPDALLLETKLGFIESDLTLTLQETRSVVQQALAHAMKALGDHP
jgi:flagellar biosynthesis/type III secretory pathway protein FliH